MEYYVIILIFIVTVIVFISANFFQKSDFTS